MAAGGSSQDGDEEEEQDEEIRRNNCSDDLYQPPVNYNWTQSKEAMKAVGLSNKHSGDCELLQGFTKYFQDHLSVPKYQQEVDSVGKLLYFCNPSKPTLDFFCTIHKTIDFFDKIRSTGAKNQTTVNYMKYINRFVQYALYFTDLKHTDAGLYSAGEHYSNQLKQIGKQFSKGVSVELVERRNKDLHAEEMTPGECVAILKKAKEDFIKQIEKLSKNETISVQEQTTVLYYLECILVLKNAQQPGVIKNLFNGWPGKTTIDKSGKNRAVVSVKKHKTAAQQMASFCLDSEEENWFNQYYHKLRPQFLLKNSRDMDPPQEFFLSTTGEPIYNPSSDINRFLKRYNITKMNSQIARRVIETATKNYSDAQKSKVADYLAHSNQTAEKHYRMRTVANICEAANIVDEIIDYNQSSNKEEDPGPSPPLEQEVQDRATTSETSHKLKNISGRRGSCQTPSEYISSDTRWQATKKKNQRLAVFGQQERQIYDKWRINQQNLRAIETLEYFSRRLPTETEIANYFIKMRWEVNTPST